jgi:hypothetical protein
MTVPEHCAAGAIFGSEVSRLARNNRDRYQLLDLCALLNTLILDTEGIYDPAPAQRPVAGVEGHDQRGRAELAAPARSGRPARQGPPGRTGARAAGRLRAHARGRVEKDPDQRVQQAIALVFERFAALGSARQVLLCGVGRRILRSRSSSPTAWGGAPRFGGACRSTAPSCASSRTRSTPAPTPSGALPATQPGPYAPWAIRREDLALERVQRAAETVKEDRRHSATSSWRIS